MICVDASVAVKWIAREEYSDQARTLYRVSFEAGEPLVAPPLMPIEVTNILRQKMRVPGGLSLEESLGLLDDFFAFRFTLLDPPGLHQRALALAHAYGFPAAYDAHYLALSELMQCELWTDDRRLLRQVRHDFPFVRWLGDFGVP